MLECKNRLKFCAPNRALTLGVLGKNAGGSIKYETANRRKVEADHTSIKFGKKRRVNMKIRAAVAPLMNRMKTRGASFAGAVAVALGMMSLTPAAPAQQPGSQATIPFAFSINQQEFPAGHYRVQLASENVLRLVSYKTGESAGVVVRTTRNLEKSPRNVLVFEHDDQGYELTSVQFGLGPVETQAALRSKAVTERMKFTRLISAR